MRFVKQLELNTLSNYADLQPPDPRISSDAPAPRSPSVNDTWLGCPCVFLTFSPDFIISAHFAQEPCGALEFSFSNLSEASSGSGRSCLTMCVFDFRAEHYEPRQRLGVRRANQWARSIYACGEPSGTKWLTSPGLQVKVEIAGSSSHTQNGT